VFRRFSDRTKNGARRRTSRLAYSLSRPGVPVNIIAGTCPLAFEDAPGCMVWRPGRYRRWGRRERRGLAISDFRFRIWGLGGRRVLAKTPRRKSRIAEVGVRRSVLTRSQDGQDVPISDFGFRIGDVGFDKITGWAGRTDFGLQISDLGVEVRAKVTPGQPVCCFVQSEMAGTVLSQGALSAPKRQFDDVFDYG